MQNTKPNRAQRRAAQSNGKPKFKASRSFFVRDLNCYATRRNCTPPDTRPQISAPSRATRFDGMT
jgi:hypothetical protein